MRIFFNFFPLLNSSQRKKFYLLFFLTVISILLEVISIGSIVPVVLFFLGEQLENIKFFISFENEFFKNISQKDIIKYILIFIFSAFIVKNLILIYTAILQSKVTWEIEFFFRKKIFEKFLNEDLEYHTNKSSSYKINLLIC